MFSGVVVQRLPLLLKMHAYDSKTVRSEGLHLWRNPPRRERGALIFLRGELCEMVSFRWGNYRSSGNHKTAMCQTRFWRNQGRSCCSHSNPTCGMNEPRQDSTAPIQPLDAVLGQHIVVSTNPTNRTVNICSVVAVESAELPILMVAQAQYIFLHVSSHM